MGGSLLIPEALSRVRRLLRLLSRAAGNARRGGIVPAGVLAGGAVAAVFALLALRAAATPEPTTAAVRELELLAPYAGERFWTNITPHAIAYHTESAVIGQLPLEGLRALRADAGLVSTISQNSSGWEQAREPNLFFLSRHGIVSAIADSPEASFAAYSSYLDRSYPVVAASPYGSAIYDLGRPFGEQEVVSGSATPVPDDLVLHAPETAQASSAQGLSTPNLLLDGDVDSFWHRRVEDSGAGGDLGGVGAAAVEIPAWIQLDLGAPARVELLRVHPRNGFADQFWRFGAMLQGSADGRAWDDLHALVLEAGAPPNGWVGFPLTAEQPYRFYRLTIWDPWMFALGEVQLYGPPSGG